MSTVIHDGHSVWLPLTTRVSFCSFPGAGAPCFAFGVGTAVHGGSNGMRWATAMILPLGPPAMMHRIPSHLLGGSMCN